MEKIEAERIKKAKEALLQFQKEGPYNTDTVLSVLALVQDAWVPYYDFRPQLKATLLSVSGKVPERDRKVMLTIAEGITRRERTEGGERDERDKSPSRKSSKHKSTKDINIEDEARYKVEALVSLTKTTEAVLKNLNTFCYQLHSVNRLGNFAGRPIGLHWNQYNWKKHPEIKALLANPVEIEMFQHVKPKFCLTKIEPVLEKAQTLADLVNEIHRSYIKFFDEHAGLYLYPSAVDASFMFGWEGNSPKQRFLVNMFRENIPERDEYFTSLQPVAQLVPNLLDFVTHLVAKSVTSWITPKAWFEACKGTPPEGQWELDNGFQVDSNKHRWVRGAFYTGGKEITEGFFHLPLSLLPEYRDEKAEEKGAKVELM